jgi:hypothetical protein
MLNLEDDERLNEVERNLVKGDEKLVAATKEIEEINNSRSNFGIIVVVIIIVLLTAGFITYGSFFI